MPIKENNIKINIVSGCLIKKGKKFLMVQEAKDYVYGKWNFPGGRLEGWIDLISNAVREVKEETGFDVEIKGLVNIYQGFCKERNSIIIYFAFKGEIVAGKPKFDKKEILDIKWFSLEEIKKMNKENKLRWPEIELLIKNYLKSGTYKNSEVLIFDKDIKSPFED